MGLEHCRREIIYACSFGAEGMVIFGISSVNCPGARLSSSLIPGFTFPKRINSLKKQKDATHPLITDGQAKTDAGRTKSPLRGQPVEKKSRSLLPYSESSPHARRIKKRQSLDIRLEKRAITVKKKYSIYQQR